jgi:hypothetical protein
VLCCDVGLSGNTATHLEQVYPGVTSPGCCWMQVVRRMEAGKLKQLLVVPAAMWDDVQLQVQ